MGLNENLEKDLYLFIGRTDQNLGDIKDTVAEHKHKLENIGKIQIDHEERLACLERNKTNFNKVISWLFNPKRGLIPFLATGGSLITWIVMQFGG